jgi:chemotaxis protein histidine kinase CheA
MSRSRTFARYLLLCSLMLLALACKPMGGSSYAEAPYDYGTDEAYAYAAAGGAAPGAAGDDDYGITTIAASESSGRGRAKREFKDAPAPAAPAPAPAPVADTPTTAEPESLAPPDEPAQPAPISQKRQIIYTATMQVSVFELEHATELVEALPDRFGGWLQQRVDNQLILRIPAERLDEAIALVAELGVVDYRLLEALDVTAEYTDLDSRIRVLAEMQKQLQALLAKATSVEQALEIRRALDRVTLELESARAQMRELSKSIAFSTLIVRLVQRGPTHAVPSSNDPFHWVDELGVEATDYR